MNSCISASALCVLIIAGALSSGCSDGHDALETSGDETGATAEALTVYTGVGLWDPDDPIDACFLADGTDLPTHEAWIKADIRRTWEYYTNISVNWLSECPATGSLIRIGLKGRTDPSDGEGGWASGVGLGARRDERATANANAGSPDLLKPSVKLYLQPDPANSSRNRVAYLGIHEFGHVLGFAHEQEHPDSTCPDDDDPAQTALTAYDGDSIMNYCASPSQATLSPLDWAGAQSLYGVGSRYQAGQLAAARWHSAVGATL